MARTTSTSYDLLLHKITCCEILGFSHFKSPGEKNLYLVQKRDFSQSQRIEGQIWAGYADTMIGLKRLNNLQYCIETVLREGVEGDLIETGVWRGGACIFMRAVLAAYGIVDRKVFVADSFEGLPKPDDRKYPADKGDKHHIYTYLAVSKASGVRLK